MSVRDERIEAAARAFYDSFYSRPPDTTELWDNDGLGDTYRKRAAAALDAADAVSVPPNRAAILSALRSFDYIIVGGHPGDEEGYAALTDAIVAALVEARAVSAPLTERLAEAAQLVLDESESEAWTTPVVGFALAALGDALAEYDAQKKEPRGDL